MTTKTTRKTKKVAPRLVARMMAHYGTIEAARDAYRAARAVCRAVERGGSGMVPWVAMTGQIIPSFACEVFYAGSCDAMDVLPG